MVERVIVSVSFPENGDENSGILLVGKKKTARDADIINVFKGKEARELYDKLTKRKVAPEV